MTLLTSSVSILWESISGIKHINNYGPCW